MTDEFLREHAAAINTAKAARMAVLDGGPPPGDVTEVVPENPAVGFPRLLMISIILQLMMVVMTQLYLH